MGSDWSLCPRGGTTAAERCVLLSRGLFKRHRETQQIITGKENLNVIMIVNRQFIKQNQKANKKMKRCPNST